jgi:hypothetical protein
MGTAHIPEPPVARPPTAQAAPAGGASAGGGTPQEPPDEFIDPISAELMLDPVLLLDSGQVRTVAHQLFALPLRSQPLRAPTVWLVIAELLQEHH